MTKVNFYELGTIEDHTILTYPLFNHIYIKSVGVSARNMINIQVKWSDGNE